MKLVRPTEPSRDGVVVGHCKRHSTTVYIGRGKGGSVPATPGERGWLGNPVRLGEECPICHSVHSKSGSTLECYRQWLHRELAADPDFREAFFSIDSSATLGCWCKSRVDGPEPCHGDVVKEVLDACSEDDFVP